MVHISRFSAFSARLGPRAILRSSQSQQGQSQTQRRATILVISRNLTAVLPKLWLWFSPTPRWWDSCRTSCAADFAGNNSKPCQWKTTRPDKRDSWTKLFLYGSIWNIPWPLPQIAWNQSFDMSHWSDHCELQNHQANACISSAGLLMTDAGLKSGNRHTTSLPLQPYHTKSLAIHGTSDCMRPNGNLQDLIAHSTADLQVPTLPWGPATAAIANMAWWQWTTLGLSRSCGKAGGGCSSHASALAIPRWSKFFNFWCWI